MQNFIKKVIEGQTLSQQEAHEVMNDIMSGQFKPEQLGAFLTALRMRGETLEEIVGFASSIRKHAKAINITRVDLVDTCGTGGDGANTFNISTAVAFVVAGAGVGVAKHGNRSVSSRCGSADVYEALGLSVESEPSDIAAQIDNVGLGFLYAPAFHPAMGAVGPIRRSLGVRTVFNVLGPLSNPARVKRQVMGVFNNSLLDKLAGVLKNLGSEEALVVTGDDGLDELSLSTTTRAVHLKDGQLKKIVISPEDAGLKRAGVETLKGGDAAENSGIIVKVLEGEKGPRRDVVVLNAAAAVMVAGLAKNLRDAAAIAAEVIDQGKALAVLSKLQAGRKS